MPRRLFFNERGDLVAHRLGDGRGKPVRAKFYELKIIRELFPKNVPRIRGVEELVNGSLLHFNEVPLNPELKEYMRLLLHEKGTTQIKGHEYESHEFLIHEAKVKKNKVIRALTRQMHGLGIDSHSSIYMLKPLVIFPTGNASNVSIANPHAPMFFEPRIDNPRKLRRRLRKMQMGEQKKAQLLRWLDRYETLMAESWKID